MSLEAAILENTSAIRELIARLSATSPTAVTMTAAEYVQTIDKAVAAPVATPAVAIVAPVAPVVKSQELDEAVAKVEAAAAPLDYAKDVKPKLIQVSMSKGRDALVALLAKFGVTKGDALPAGELRNVVAEIDSLLAA